MNPIRDPWECLGIDPCTDRKVIKKAYFGKLKTCNPETDPKGFQLLREAYEKALEMSERGGNRSLFGDATHHEPSAPSAAVETDPFQGRVVQFLAELTSLIRNNDKQAIEVLLKAMHEDPFWWQDPELLDQVNLGLVDFFHREQLPELGKELIHSLILHLEWRTRLPGLKRMRSPMVMASTLQLLDLYDIERLKLELDETLTIFNDFLYTRSLNRALEYLKTQLLDFRKKHEDQQVIVESLIFAWFAELDLPPARLLSVYRMIIAEIELTQAHSRYLDESLFFQTEARLQEAAKWVEEVVSSAQAKPESKLKRWRDLGLLMMLVAIAYLGWHLNPEESTTPPKQPPEPGEIEAASTIELLRLASVSGSMNQVDWPLIEERLAKLAPHNTLPITSPLIRAVFARDIGSAQQLLREGADPNAQTLTSPLLIAALNQDTPMVELLISYGIHTNYGDPYADRARDFARRSDNMRLYHTLRPGD